MKKKAAYLGVFAAAALLLSYVESLIPVFITVPGMKLGLANLMTVLALVLYSWKEAACVSAVRILLAGFLFGNLFSILFAAAGGLCSLFVMTLLKRSDHFSLVGISIAGGVFHNVGQLLTAALVVEHLGVFYYGSVLLISGCVTGALIGILAGEMKKRVQGLLLGEKR